MMHIRESGVLRAALRGVGLVVAVAALGIRSALPANSALADAHMMLQDLRSRQMVGAGHLSPESFRQLQEETKSALPKVKHLVDVGILGELNRGLPPSSRALEESLWASLTSNTEPDPRVATVVACNRPGGPVYIVTYFIGYWGDHSMSSVNVYGRAGAQFKLLAQADDPLPNRSVSLSLLPSVRNNELAFLVDGVYWGDPHNHLRVVVYTFDGHKLTTLLTRSDLVQGRVKVEGPQIALTFLTIARGPGSLPALERTEIYRVTSAGIKLEKSWEEKPK